MLPGAPLYYRQRHDWANSHHSGIGLHRIPVEYTTLATLDYLSLGRTPFAVGNLAVIEKLQMIPLQDKTPTNEGGYLIY